MFITLLHGDNNDGGEREEKWWRDARMSALHQYLQLQ